MENYGVSVGGIPTIKASAVSGRLDLKSDIWPYSAPVDSEIVNIPSSVCTQFLD
jgi:hypothetical protein